MPHLDRELLAAVARGEMPPVAVVEIGWNHLLELCPHCHREVQAWRRSAGAQDYRAAFARLAASLPGAAARAARGREEAERWLAALLPLPQAERMARLRRARRRYRGPAFAEALLAAARARLPGHPRESGELAELAQEAVFRSPLPEGVGAALSAQALALSGNARRGLGRLGEAEGLLAAARKLLAESPAADLLVVAELDRLEGALRKDQRRFAESETLLNRAVLLYTTSGEAVTAARCLLTLSSLCDAEGLPERALQATWRALGLLDPEKEPDLYLAARYNMGLYLHSAGRHREAVATLAEDADRYAATADPALAVRVRWLQGKLAAALEDPEEAAEAFAEVRAYFAEADEAFSYAAAGLDLALVHLGGGRWAEVREVAAETVAYFGAHGVHREALGALALFQRAAEEEALTAAWLGELARYLERARTDSEARFEAPS
jgi:hypothetical protein